MECDPVWIQNCDFFIYTDLSSISYTQTGALLHIHILKLYFIYTD